MLAPIMTKEMKLFPTQPLPSRIKNVRSRAQSLRDFYGPTTIGQGNANSLILLNEAGGNRAVRQKNSKSISNLPMDTKVKDTQRNQMPETSSSNSKTAPVEREKSPKKGSSSLISVKKPLDSIVEGVEMQSIAGSSQKSETIHRDAPSKTSKNLSGKDERKKHHSTCSTPSAEKIKNNMHAKAKKKHPDAKNTGCFALWLRRKGKPKEVMGASSSSTDSSSTNGDCKETTKR